MILKIQISLVFHKFNISKSRIVICVADVTKIVSFSKKKLNNFFFTKKLIYWFVVIIISKLHLSSYEICKNTNILTFIFTK